jgi:LmbE family N-acetylglucosaminyl deacetylase
MLPLTVGRQIEDVRVVLCLGAHCDDIEIGCGGTILQLLSVRPHLEIHWIIYSSSPKRAEEARKSASAFLEEVRHKSITIHEFRDGFFPFQGAEIKENFEALKEQLKPDIIFTHYREDLHQDHRTISDLTWNSFRDHVIFEYEIPKYDGDFGAPNLFAPLPKGVCQRKVETILDCFASQREKGWFSPELFFAALRIRGMEANAPTGYAEAFYCRKAVII